LAGFIVNGIGLRWEFAMLLAAVIKVITGLSVFLLLKEAKREQLLLQDSLLDEANPEEGTHEKNYKFKEFISFAKKTIKPLENKLYLFAFGLLKSILYGFLLWMPTYLTHNGFKAYSSSVPIVFNAGTLIGSSFLGYFYKNHEVKDPNSLGQRVKKHLKGYSLFYSCIGVTVIFVFFYIITPEIVAYFFLSAVSGAFLGGCFNMLAGN
jgi:hypothetical protein